MASKKPEEAPKSDDAAEGDAEHKGPKVIKSASDLARIKLERLMSKPVRVFVRRTHSPPFFLFV
jgi:hypothetical protein